jgi:hypothetical protein
MQCEYEEPFGTMFATRVCRSRLSVRSGGTNVADTVECFEFV